ncbi:MAG: CBS domain-containing protein, partial [Pseudomonadota bacterium]
KVYNNNWMQQKGFMEQPARMAIDLVKNPDTDVITVKTSELVSHAVGRMRKYKISQIPVVDKQGFVGAIDEMALFSAYLDDHRKSDTPISEVMHKPFPMVQEFSPIEEVLDLIRKGNSAVLVALENEKHGIITKSDVLSHIQ